ncbi:cysteine hydrolase family protein [Brochothrix thermosphacta]|uniref:cysteine hydrolase family protein n=1 Tax=Brochothrix thermosphacta TaxID=2756 RepID=UPI000EECF33F|nr:cysteine hydrolase family protein [Brochothrix thermosphacta]HCZ46300.1 cysteine hydrolase [Brochothrix thermosphacta]
MKPLADALIIIDLQNGVCYNDTEIFNLSSLVTLINKRMLDYTSQGKNIIIVQHTDEDLIQGQSPWEVIPSLDKGKATHYIQKTHANSFYKTNLKELLEQEHISSIEICGAQTEYCVDATVKNAHALGYLIQMLRGGTTTYSNAFMSAENTVRFYENIWDNRFATFI